MTPTLAGLHCRKRKSRPRSAWAMVGKSWSRGRMGKKGEQPTQRSGEEQGSGVNALPAVQLHPMGHWELGVMYSAQCWGRRPLPLHRHCENTPFSVLFTVTSVCPLLLLSLEQNTQGIVSFCFCEKRGPCSTRGQGDPARGHRRGHGRSPQTLLPLTRARELSGSTGT